MCDLLLNLEECNENDVFECPKCRTRLEIVSLTPAVLEAISEEDGKNE
jgi:lysine biosynthesis protein LysW